MKLSPVWLMAATAAMAAAADGFPEAQGLLNKYCLACHSAQTKAGGFRLEAVADPASLRLQPRLWTALAHRIRESEMPPKGAPALPLEQRETILAWVDASLRREACANGPVAGPSLIRRLNRDEYASTIRDLLDLQIDVSQTLPVDGACGEGFDNAAETLFLSPLHSEKYMELAKMAMDFASKDFKPRARILIAQPGAGGSPEAAAREILSAFLPRAFRRPVTEAETKPYLDLFSAAIRQGQPFESAVFFALRGVLVSPMFLFRAEPPNPTRAQRPLDAFALASRLSYFLWSSMPDELLFDLAAGGKLQDPEVLRALVPLMLRNDRSFVFAQRFTGQWLHTRELDHNKAPDATAYPLWSKDADLRGDIRLQPVYFFRELLMRDRPILDLIDSQHTIGTRHLEKHFGLKLPLNNNANTQPQWVELPAGSRRGGLLGMPAVLAVSSHSYRTSPVLRGAFILEALLGTPPPPPPPDVPLLEENKEGATPKTVRERLAQHRASAACAGCHSRIDPLGFALENYDVMGKWRDEEAGKPVDASGEMTDGTKINGPDELKAALLERRDVFARNLTAKLLGYALGRGLTLSDACTVDAIVRKLKDNGYRSRVLIEEIVVSAPFREQAGQP